MAEFISGMAPGRDGRRRTRSPTGVRNPTGRYRWIERYGSPHYSANNPEVEGRDLVPVEAVRLSSDGRTIFLQTPPLKPVMQMKVAWNIRAADGTPVRNELYHTINAVP